MLGRQINPGLLLVVLGLAVPLYSQQTTTPCPAADSSQASADQKGKSKKDNQPAASDSSCPPAHEPSTAEKFPFPGSASAPPLPGAPPPEPDAPFPAGRPKSAAEEHPFPGNAPPMPGSEDSSSSSSSDGYSSSSSGDDTTAADTPKEEPAADSAKSRGRRRLPKVQKLQSDEDRVEEDLKVARFYENKGDLNAAYLRLQDAVKTMPNDSMSHYALARMAQKLNKNDEAAAEYRTYIKLEPDGEDAGKAQKALSQLQKQ